MPVDPSNNISGFVNAFSGGGLRTNLFKVSGTIPGYPDGRNIAFLCKAASIPASSLGTIEVPYRGRKIRIPGDRTFQDWQITIISDASMKLRSHFEHWSSQFNSHKGNVGDNNMFAIMPTWSITQLLRTGDALRTYSFFGCFPSDIGPIDMAFDNNDQIAEFPVTLNYSWWEAVEGGSTPSGGGDAISSILQFFGIPSSVGFG